MGRLCKADKKKVINVGVHIICACTQILLWSAGLINTDSLHGTSAFLFFLFSPYRKPFVETPGGYWVLSREESKDVCMGTRLMPLFSAPKPWSEANTHIASAGAL